MIQKRRRTLTFIEGLFHLHNVLRIRQLRLNNLPKVMQLEVAELRTTQISPTLHALPPHCTSTQPPMHKPWDMPLPWPECPCPIGQLAHAGGRTLSSSSDAVSKGLSPRPDSLDTQYPCSTGQKLSQSRGTEASSRSSQR